jgi:hypothetical protein
MHQRGVTMKYTGKLKKQIVRKRIGILSDEDAYLAEAKRITDEMFAKLPDLFAAYGLKQGDWVFLAMELAKAHVPGFQVIKPAGRKTEWDISQKAEFRLDVDAVMAKNGLSVVEAIKLTIRSTAWAAKAAPMTIAALEQHYYKADMRWVQIVKDARAYESIVATN